MSFSRSLTYYTSVYHSIQYYYTEYTILHNIILQKSEHTVDIKESCESGRPEFHRLLSFDQCFLCYMLPLLIQHFQRFKQALVIIQIWLSPIVCLLSCLPLLSFLSPHPQPVTTVVCPSRYLVLMEVSSSHWSQVLAYTDLIVDYYKWLAATVIVKWHYMNQI